MRQSGEICDLIGCSLFDIIEYSPGEELPEETDTDHSHQEAESISVGKNIAYLIKERDIKHLTDFARICGVPRPTLHNIITGRRRNPRRETLVAIANGLNVPLMELYRERPAEGAESA